METKGKAKLPGDLQPDSISPATRLLEKRRNMYEVQKNFEDQKKEYQDKEKRFHEQENELRQKDFLIQENLIKFSTFLQQQEMRKKKDQELKGLEEKKIEQLEEEILEKNQLHELYQAKAKRIEDKVNAMKKYETFLERVKDQNPDEIGEIQDILSRYKQLSNKNQELHRSQDGQTSLLDKMSKDLASHVKDMQTEKFLIDNHISDQQREIEKVDSEKSNLLAKRDESAQKISQ
jgi:DNA repair exonuclease SbcCD ATPase subunit